MNTNGSVNKIILTGQITREPRWHISNSIRWLHFTLITREIIRSGAGTTDDEETHQVKIAEQSRGLKDLDLKKDSHVFLEGKIKTQAFTDADQIRRFRTEIVAGKIEILENDRQAAARRVVY